LIDTHTHLYLKQFNEDIDDVISRALSVGVKRFYMPSINSSYNRGMLDLMSRYPKNIFCMIGLHPCYVDEDYKKELDFVKDEIRIEISSSNLSLLFNFAEVETLI